MKQDMLHIHPFGSTRPTENWGGHFLCNLSLRALFIVPFVLIICSFLCLSCEKELFRYPEIAAYHAESQQLGSASRDSVTRFTQKVNAFVRQNPAATSDPYYPVILENISRRTGSLSMTIIINGEWAGDTAIYY